MTEMEYHDRFLREHGFMPTLTMTPGRTTLDCYALDESKPRADRHTPAQDLPVSHLSQVFQTPEDDHYPPDFVKRHLLQRAVGYIRLHRLIGFTDPYHGHPEHELTLRQELARREHRQAEHQMRRIALENEP